MMAEDATDCDSLCLDLDLLTPSHVRDSASGRRWGGSQCSGESTGLQTDDVMSSRDSPESESGVIGECSGYEQTSPPLSGKSVGVKIESILQVGSLSTARVEKRSGEKLCECIS